MNAVGEKVCSIGNQNNDTALRLGEAADIGKLEEQGGADTSNDTNQQGTKKDQQEDASTFKEAEYSVAGSLALFVSLRRLENDNGDGVVEDRLAKDDGVKLGVDLVRVENGENGDGIGGRQGRSDRDGVDKGHVDGSRNLRVQPEDHADNHSRQKRAGKGKGQNGANVSEEVGLV